MAEWINQIRFRTTDLPGSMREEIGDALRKALHDPSGRGPALDIEVDAERIDSTIRVIMEAHIGGSCIKRTGEGKAAFDAAGRAARAFREILEKHGEYIRGLTGRTPVMELNILARHFTEKGEEAPRRHFVKKLSFDEACIELELSDEPGMIFFNKDTSRASVMLHHGDGRFALLEPGFDATGGAGVETMLMDLKLESALAPDDDGRAAPSPEDMGGRTDKYVRLRPHLRCPVCRSKVEERDGGLHCAPCGRTYPVVESVPVMATDPDLDPEPRESPVSKNPYGQQVLQVIDKYPQGLVLDCGSGSPAVCFSNVVHLEIVRYPGVDIVANGESLPFADATFDAVISEAVLEHVQNPFGYVKELWRVLKPGGEIRMDAAFLQPYHAFPHHYFNMTLSGLELLMKDFERIDSGCGPHQQPYVMLDLVLRAFLEGIPDPDQRERARETTIGEALRIIEEEGEKGPFQILTREAVSKLAAGFYYFGFKPSI